MLCFVAFIDSIRYLAHTVCSNWRFSMNGEDMQRRTSEGNGRSVRARRTQPALPGMTLPTASITVQQQNVALQRSPVSRKHTRPAKRAAFKLIGLGLLLALLYMA